MKSERVMLKDGEEGGRNEREIEGERRDGSEGASERWCGTRVGLMSRIDACRASCFPSHNLLGVDGTFSSSVHFFHSPPFPIVLS